MLLYISGFTMNAQVTVYKVFTSNLDNCYDIIYDIISILLAMLTVVSNVHLGSMFLEQDR